MVDDISRHPAKSPFPVETDEHKNSLFLESIIDGFFACDEEWRFVYVNATAERVLGIKRSEVIGKNHWEVYPQTLSTLMEHEYRLAASGQSRDFEYYCKLRGRWFHNRCFPRKSGGISVYLQDITERKLAEDALIRERNVLQSVMNGAKNSHLVFLDRDFNFVRVNEAYAATCGYRPEEMIGKNHFDLYPHAENEAIFARVRDTGEPFEVHDKPFKFPDQPERGITYWDWTLSPVKDEAGEVTGLVFSLFETTRRKRAEKALKSSERKFRHLFEKHSATMLLIDPVSLRILDANRAASKFYGYSRSEMQAMKINQINCLPSHEFSELAKSIENRKLHYFVTPHRLADGSVRTVEVYLSQIVILGKRIDFVIIHDITERKAAEDALRRNEARLKAVNDKLLESEQRLRLFIEHAPVALAMFDREMRYISTSRRWSKNYNLGKRDLTGMLHYEVFPDLPERWLDAHRRGLAGEVLKEEADLYERADGSHNWSRWELRPWYNLSGEIGGIVIFTEDITERKQQEVQLQILNEELEQRVKDRTRELIETQHQYLHAEKLAAIGKLSASIAHEVNSPLQSILTVLKSVSRQTILEEMDLKLIEIAIGEGDRIKGLIRSLQDFYRPSPRKKSLLDINSTLDLLLLLHKSELKNKGILVELDYDYRLPIISAIPDQIKQVFLNLLTNAKEACLQGGVITVSTRQQGDKVAIVIKDTGVGIKPEQMDQIFRPFYTTKSAVKGTGLGLSVSYGIVNNHGGEILVTSKPGEGAIFTVLLPICKSDPIEIQ
ncbi:MAG: PAS/PAC sensor signal transduction histidine kinase [uncultured bacterium]|nr:MAG: PAS/PAC sensor signal transduction histidine kinase [uncultured bacterium]HBG17841.1 hypothetical protein [Desulfobulbaceae bacterium]